MNKEQTNNLKNKHNQKDDTGWFLRGNHQNENGLEVPWERFKTKTPWVSRLRNTSVG